MRTFLLALGGALGLGCHFDKLVSGSAAQHPAASATAAPAALVFATQPRSTTPNTAISPPVQVSVEDRDGRVITAFTGRVVITLGTDGSLLHNAQLSGDTVVAAAQGIATFANLRIDQLGTGYTLVAALDAGGPRGESAPFDITATPTVSRSVAAAAPRAAARKGIVTTRLATGTEIGSRAQRGLGRAELTGT